MQMVKEKQDLTYLSWSLLLISISKFSVGKSQKNLSIIKFSFFIKNYPFVISISVDVMNSSIEKPYCSLSVRRNSKDGRLIPVS